MDFVAARENMIECQLRTNKITDRRILDAMESIPRERFVPSGKEEFAYADVDIPCAAGRYLMAPMAVARLVQEAEIKAEDAVLCVGAGTGYAVSVLAQLADSVIALESDPACCKTAGELFSELSFDNAVLVEGELRRGWKKESPYDVIFIDGMVSDIPDELFNQLSVSGRLVGIVDSGDGIGRATLYIKLDHSVSSRGIFDITVGLLPEFDKEQEFVF